MEDKLPENWIETELGKITTKPQYGWTSKAAPGGNVKYLRTTDLSKGKVNWETVPFCVVEPDNIEKYQLEKNDIVISRAGSVGLSFRIDDPPKNTIFASYLIRFKPITVETKLIEYFLKSPNYWNSISQISAGIAVQNVNASNLAELKFPLPPLPEQKRIVAKLDQLFGHLDVLKAKLEKIPALLAKFRQSVLTQAVTGKLTEAWREGKELGEWEDSYLSNLIIEKPRNGYSPRGVDYVTDVKSLSLAATTSGSFDPNYVKYLDIEKPSEDSHLWLKKGDILIQRSNSLDYVGTSAIYDGDDFDFIYPDLMMKVRVNDMILPEYLYYCLSARDTREYFRQNATGTAGNMPKINQGVVMNTPISLPTIDEQREIVAQVAHLLLIVERIKSQYDTLKDKVANLPQAILTKAFRGGLVPQDPNDEPAAELLEKIKGASDNNQKKTSKAKKERKRKPGKKHASSMVYGKEAAKNTIKQTQVTESANPIERQLWGHFGKKRFSFEDIPEIVSSNHEELRKSIYNALDNETGYEGHKLTLLRSRTSLYFKFEII